MPRGGSRGGSGRPKIADDMQKITAAFSLNPVLVKKLAETAKQRGISKSEVVEAALTEYFEE